MKVSIIIPCYRQAHYLANAIESCLAQTYKPIEIIVVNDGSDDDTEQVARSFGDRIRYVWRANGGLAAARNTGISHASGQFLKLLDSDDHLHPEQIEWQVQALAERPGAVSLTTVRAYQADDPRRFEDFAPTIQNLLPDMLDNPDCGVHGFLFPSELVRAVRGFSESCRIAEDWEFFCRLGRLRVPVLGDHRVGAYYRLQRDSMSTCKAGMAIEVARQLIAMHDEFREGPLRDWFGSKLLGSEQRAYRRLLLNSSPEPELEEQLLKRILELRKIAKPPSGTWKFDVASLIFGYRSAERLLTAYASMRRRRTSMPTHGSNATVSENKKRQATYQIG